MTFTTLGIKFLCALSNNNNNNLSLLRVACKVHLASKNFLCKIKMSNICFTFAYFTFNRPIEVQESNKAGIHLFHGRASERYLWVHSFDDFNN